MASSFNFDYVCVIDYEATCEKNKRDYPNEIIEFPIVLINLKTLRIEDHFQSFVKPVLNPVLSKFCVELTGITQAQVDAADRFPRVFSKVNDWLAEKQLGSKYSFAVASDGPWDFENFLNMQCKHSNVDYPHWAREWIDVRKLFADTMRVRSRGVGKMLGYFGLSFEGHKHSGLDDSMNIARILLQLINHGCDLKLNQTLKNPL